MSKSPLSPQEKRVKFLTFQFNLSAVVAVMTAVSSLYIASNMDNGKSFDLQGMVEEIVNQRQMENPALDRAEFTKTVSDAADEGEKNIRYACGGFTLLGFGMAGWRRRQLNKALENAPR
jgi:hypothetical protein